MSHCDFDSKIQLTNISVKQTRAVDKQVELLALWISYLPNEPRNEITPYQFQEQWRWAAPNRGIENQKVEQEKQL